jgi:hypothetical protein
VAVPISRLLLLQTNLATPDKKKSKPETQAQRAQGTLQVEKPIPKVKGIMDGKKPHTSNKDI